MESDAYLLIEALLTDPADAEKLLAETPSLLDARTGTGETALHYLAVESRVEAVRWLIERGAVVNCEDEFGDRPLRCASSLGYEAMVRLLLEHGADVRAARPDGETPLHAAAGANHPDIMRILLDAGAEVDAPTDMRETPLFSAARHGADAVVEMLVARGADVNRRAAFEQAPLHVVQSVASAQTLIDAGADIHALDCNGGTVLHAAARAGNDALCAFFVELGLDPAAKDEEGRTVEDERSRGERIRPQVRAMMAPMEDAMRALQQHFAGDDVDVPDIPRLMNDMMRQMGVEPGERDES